MIIASLIGLLALVVSGYTAWVQREQIRAQVWPHLLVGYNDPDNELVVINKGVGPAIVRDVEITVDGKPQRDWQGVFDALGMPTATASMGMATLDTNVLSPNEHVEVMSLKRSTDYQRFRNATAAGRVAMHICFCSTLGDCWTHTWLNHDSGNLHRVSTCPRLSDKDRFED